LIARIIDYCARNPLVVILLVAALLGWGIWAIVNTPLDAIPDLSDTQVIIFTEWMGRSPDLVEDQITYPIVTSLLGAPRVTTVRGQSMFGMSFIYVIFEEGTDIYWARSRVLEYLSTVRAKLPADVAPQLGPDATGVGWVYEYALVEKPICPVYGKVTTRQSEFRADYQGKHFYFDSHHCLETFADDPARFATRPSQVESKLDLAQLRSYQDWSLRYALQSVQGVAEVPGDS
jgi:Cu/Ag efflux pump CusA